MNTISGGGDISIPRHLSSALDNHPHFATTTASTSQLDYHNNESANPNATLNIPPYMNQNRTFGGFQS